ncbi:MAG: ACP phosphodiesterase [Prevotellaceae bacterium]|jgi:acyl carrier protein phosphodiesterase|nr:ACP phosphodiesterase [Prevotellaceae bacterium]
MNYLAHIYLSGDNSGRKIGGFIADFVKGNQLLGYPSDVQSGIRLHRQVDTFTDRHPYVLKIKELLRPAFGRYSGIFLDIFYDYFLAKNFDEYSSTPLLKFSRTFYLDTVGRYTSLPATVKGFAWHFMLTNRLCKYAELSGIQRALEIMSRYSSLPPLSHEAVAFLKRHNDVLEKNFRDFFPDLQRLSFDFIRNEQRPA